MPKLLGYYGILNYHTIVTEIDAWGTGAYLIFVVIYISSIASLEHFVRNPLLSTVALCSVV